MTTEQFETLTAMTYTMSPDIAGAIRAALNDIEATKFELDAYKQACRAKSVRAISDGTHTLMNAAVGNVSGIFEAEYGPCYAIKKAEELMLPAWDAWGILLTEIARLRKALGRKGK